MSASARLLSSSFIEFSASLKENRSYSGKLFYAKQCSLSFALSLSFSLSLSPLILSLFSTSNRNVRLFRVQTSYQWRRRENKNDKLFSLSCIPMHFKVKWVVLGFSLSALKSRGAKSGRAEKEKKILDRTRIISFTAECKWRSKKSFFLISTNYISRMSSILAAFLLMCVSSAFLLG